MNPAPATPSHAPHKSSWWRRYLKQFAITFIAMSVVSGIFESFSKDNVVAVNGKIVAAIHMFNFPAVMHNALDFYYDNGEPVPLPRAILGREVRPDGSYHFTYTDPEYSYPNRHFAWRSLVLAPLSGYAQIYSMLEKAWKVNIPSFITTLLALTVGFYLALFGIGRLRNGEDKKFDPALAAWFAPFVGGIFLWSLQLVILVPFLVLGKMLSGVETAAAISATGPLLHSLVETVKAEREHALVNTIEKYAEKYASKKAT